MKSIAKQLLLPLFFVMVALSRAYAGVADDIAVLEDQRIAAYLVSDAASLEKIFADEMTYVHSSGIADTKRKVIDSFISGDLKIYKFDREQMMTREMGDLVLATAVGNVQLTMKGKDAKFSLRYSALYAKRPSGWQIVYYQGTRLP